MEGLGYVLVYFLRGQLPWQGLAAHTKKEKYDKIMEKKIGTTVDVLCRGFPAEFATYLNYCKSLRFEDRPDYAYLKRMFKDLFTREHFEYDFIFDWTVLNISQSAQAPPPAQLPPAEESKELVVAGDVPAEDRKEAQKPTRPAPLPMARVTAPTPKVVTIPTRGGTRQ